MNTKMPITDYMKEKIPYACEYIKKYGRETEDGMWEFDFPNINTAALPTQYKGRVELLFKECIETGKILEEVMPSAPKNVIL
ncbi:MAG: hypothetical protein LIO76_01225 [Clostridiales bacterium]|nr:hypothetical protein [Clostridiales bacterium]